MRKSDQVPIFFPKIGPRYYYNSPPRDGKFEEYIPLEPAELYCTVQSVTVHCRQYTSTELLANSGNRQFYWNKRSKWLELVE